MKILHKLSDQQLRDLLKKVIEEVKRRESNMGFRSTPGGSYEPEIKKDAPTYVVLEKLLEKGLAFYKYKNEESIPSWALGFNRVEIRNRIEYHSPGAERFWKEIFNTPGAKWSSEEIDKTIDLEKKLNDQIERDLIIQKTNERTKN